MHLILVIPELLWPEPGDQDVFAGLQLPALSTLIARGEHTRAAMESTDALVARHFGLPSPAPCAALRLLGEGGHPGEACWLAADPVHLHFHQERLILADAHSIGITLAETEALLAALNEESSGIGTFIALTPQHWYLRLTQPLRFAAESPRQLSGRRIERQLPETPELAELRRFLNAAQMRLHLDPVNASREAAGQTSINSLWLWGAGQLPESVSSDLHAIGSDRPLDIGLARCAGLDATPLPAGFADWQRTAAAGKTLLVSEALLEATQREDASAWRAGLEAIERDWLAPALAATGTGRLQLTLQAPTSYGLLSWHLRPRDRWRLWRRPSPLGTTARQLAEQTP